MKLLRTGGQVLTARLVGVALNAGAGLVVARALGPVGQGHYSLSLAAALLAAAVLNGGVGLAAVPPLRRREISLQRLLTAQGSWIAVAAALLLPALAVALAAGGGWLRSALGWDPLAAAAAAAGVLALLAFDILFYDLLALGRLVAGAGLNAARGAAQLACLAALASAGTLDLRGALVVFAATQALAAAAAWRLLRRAAAVAPLAARDGAERNAGRTALACRLARAGWSGQLSAVLSLLHLRLNLALLAAWHGPAAAGIYAVAMLIGELLWHLPGALSPLLVYSSASPGAALERDLLAARAMRLGVGAAAVAAVPLALASGPLVPWAFGPDFAASVPALRILLPGIVVFAGGAVLAGDFIGRGHPAWNASASALTVAVNLVGGLALVPTFGVAGAAAAAAIAYAAGTALMVHRFRRATGLSWRAIILGPRGGNPPF